MKEKSIFSLLFVVLLWRSTLMLFCRYARATNARTTTTVARLTLLVPRRLVLVLQFFIPNRKTEIPEPELTTLKLNNNFSGTPSIFFRLLYFTCLKFEYVQGNTTNNGSTSGAVIVARNVSQVACRTKPTCCYVPV
jgi:hypothetical protein